LRPARTPGRSGGAQRPTVRFAPYGRAADASAGPRASRSVLRLAIAQQDRHAGNYRWDGDAEKLGLIDHGFAFARPGQYVNQSFFVAWRWARDEQALIDAEQQALRNLLESRDLHGLGRFLLPEEAEALAARADLMLERSSILAVGEF